MADQGSMQNTAIPDEFCKRILLIIKVFDCGAEAYKKAQQLFCKIDDRIHNEFAYCARAMATVFKAICRNNYDDDFDLALNDALDASRHILNDCLDLIVCYAITESKKAENIASFSGISDVRKDYSEIRAILIAFNHKIASSRKERGILRIEEYMDMVESQDYVKLIAYCEDIPRIVADLKKKNQQEIYSSRNWVIGICISLIGIMVTLLGLLFKLYTQ